MKQPTLSDVAMMASKTEKLEAIAEEEIDLALLWAHGKVTLAQTSRAIWPERRARDSGNMIYTWLSIRLREAFSRGMVVMTESVSVEHAVSKVRRIS